jgi:hypothetical protein
VCGQAARENEGELRGGSTMTTRRLIGLLLVASFDDFRAAFDD